MKTWSDKGSKEYSPESCLFITNGLNKFLTSHDAARGGTPIGVTYHKASGKYLSLCSNPFNKKREHLGSFTCPQEAHRVWLKRKTEHAHTYADQLDQSLYSGDHEAAFHLRRLFPKIT